MLHHDMVRLVSQLVTQQVAIFTLLDADERPIVRPPVSDDSLQMLRHWLTESGRWLPESYGVFLGVCDGIEHFSVSYSLLGANDINSASYKEISAMLLEEGAGYDHRADLPPLLVGYDDETTTRVFIDFHHEQLKCGEPVVLEGDPGDMSLHASFDEFLRFRVIVNERTIERLRALRSGVGVE